jgi:D-sedoheptulose 7-phosphate isomerase
MSNCFEYLRVFAATVANMEDYDYQTKYDKIIDILASNRFRKGRVFIIGMGGSAANGQHMANDFRKIAGIDAINLSDNIAELTARANDDGFENIYIDSLKASNFDWHDVLFVLSVSGGNEKKKASIGLTKAMEYAVNQNGTLVGIVGMKDSEAEILGDTIIVTPQPSKYLTQIAESLQAVIWHGMVSDPRLIKNEAKW